MWCVCSNHLGEQKLIICCCKSTCMNLLENGTWDHVAFVGYNHFHHKHNFLHVVSLIIPIAWDPYYNNSPSKYNFIKMHSCDIIQLFNDFYPWPISLSKFLIQLVIQITDMTNRTWMVNLIYEPSFIYCQISSIWSILCDDFMKKLKSLKWQRG
jgi:hypothetical protein